MLFCFKTCAFVFSVFMQLVLTLQLLTSTWGPFVVLGIGKISIPRFLAGCRIVFIVFSCLGLLSCVFSSVVLFYQYYSNYWLLRLPPTYNVSDGA